MQQLQTWKYSVTHRCTAWVTRVAKQSVFYQVLQAMVRMFTQSYTAGIVCRLLRRDCATAHSRYARIVRHADNRLRPAGEAIKRGWTNSLLGRLAHALRWREARDNSLLAFSVRRTCLVVLALYLPIDVILRAVSPTPLVPALWDAVLFAVGIAIVLARRMQSNRTIDGITGIDAPMLFFMAIGVFLWLVNSPDMLIGFTGLRTVIQFMLFFFFVTWLVETREDIKFFLYPFLVLGLIVAFHGIWQYATGVPMPGRWVTGVENEFIRTRAFSFIGSPNVMGSLLILWVPLMAAMAYRWKSFYLKVVAWAGVGAMALASVLTFSRGGWIGLAVALLLFALIVDRRLLLLLGGAILLAMSIPAVGGRIAFMFSEDFRAASALAGRDMRWDFGMNLWREGNVWLGFGLGRFGGATAMNNQVIPEMNYFYMDNYYVKTLVEMGLLGLLSFIFLCLSGLWNAARSIFATRENRTDKVLPAAIFCGAVGILVHCFFENVFEVPYMVAYFWALLAISGRWAALIKTEKAA